VDGAAAGWPIGKMVNRERERERETATLRLPLAAGEKLR
jgi:hypothetical protein